TCALPISNGGPTPAATSPSRSPAERLQRNSRTSRIGDDRQVLGDLEHLHHLARHLDPEVTTHDRDPFETQRPDPVGYRGRKVELVRADVRLEPQQRTQEKEGRCRGPRLR